MTTEIVLNTRHEVCSHGWIHTERVATSTNFSHLAPYSDRRTVSLSFTLESAHEHFFRGREEMDSARFEQASEEFFAAVQLQWNFIEAHIELGNAYSGLRQFSRAISAYSDALEIDPGSTLALHNTALTYADLGEPALALQWLRRTIEADPAYRPAHFQTASLLRRQEKYRDAVHALMAFSRSLTKPDPDALVQAGIIYEDLGETGRSRRCYERALRADAWHPEAFHRLGLSQMAGGDLHAANLCFANALKSRPDFPEAKELFEKTRRKISRKRPKKKGRPEQNSLFEEEAA